VAGETDDARTLRARIDLEPQGGRERFRLRVDLEVPPGVTILFGPSGSGKSTALAAIAGLLRPDAGRIALGDDVWFDADLRIHAPPQARRVAYVFQSLALFPHMSALANVAYGIDRATPRPERQARARALLDKLGVGHLAGRRPRTFSGGEAQRVALARALATSPRVMLLDEPFSALDRDLRIQLAAEVRALVDELAVPLVHVTHNHGEARALGDRIIRLDAGRVVASGSVDDVLDEPSPRAAAGKRRFEDIGKTPMPELRDKR
jgi:molybdate transport system ATP-binding protein